MMGGWACANSNVNNAHLLIEFALSCLAGTPSCCRCQAPESWRPCARSSSTARSRARGTTSSWPAPRWSMQPRDTAVSSRAARYACGAVGGEWAVCSRSGCCLCAAGCFCFSGDPHWRAAHRFLAAGRSVKGSSCSCAPILSRALSFFSRSAPFPDPPIGSSTMMSAPQSPPSSARAILLHRLPPLSPSPRPSSLRLHWLPSSLHFLFFPSLSPACAALPWTPLSAFAPFFPLSSILLIHFIRL